MPYKALRKTFLGRFALLSGMCYNLHLDCATFSCTTTAETFRTRLLSAKDFIQQQLSICFFIVEKRENLIDKRHVESGNSQSLTERRVEKQHRHGSACLIKKTLFNFNDTIIDFLN